MQFNSQGLIDQWQSMSQNVSKYLAKPRHSNTKFFNLIDLDINLFVAILKTLCPIRTSFKNVLDSLIVYNKVKKFILNFMLCNQPNFNNLIFRIQLTIQWG